MTSACFISYRRASSAFIARAVFQDLRANEVDAFLDVESINQGNFRDVIGAEIRRRPYFLPILAPGTLERCKQDGDLLLKEFETADVATRLIVPVVTAEFDRADIKKYLPDLLAERFAALNSVTLEHEYFSAAMDKLRRRFLTPVDLPAAPMKPAIASESKRLLELAIKQPPIGQTVLSAQRHFERAFAAAATRPEAAVAEFGRGGDLLQQTEGAKLLLNDVNLMFKQLQAAMQRENLEFQAISNTLKAKHETLKTAIRNLR